MWCVGLRFIITMSTTLGLLWRQRHLGPDVWRVDGHRQEPLVRVASRDASHHPFRNFFFFLPGWKLKKKIENSEMNYTHKRVPVTYIYMENSNNKWRHTQISSLNVTQTSKWSHNILLFFSTFTAVTTDPDYVLIITLSCLKFYCKCVSRQAIDG